MTAEGGVVAAIVAGAFAATLVLPALVRALQASRSRLRLTWEAAAQRAGVVTQKPGGWLGATLLRGRSGNLEVTLRRAAENKAEGIEITVTGFCPEGRTLTIEPRGLARDLAGGLLRTEFQLGDPKFDAEFALEGDPLLAAAVLRAGTRSQLAALLRGTYLGWEETTRAKAWFRQGELRVFIAMPNGLSPGAFSNLCFTVLSHVLRLARRLEMTADLAASLAGNLGVGRRQAEAQEGTRLSSLRLLLRDFPDHTATAQALVAARQDPSALVRLEGALGEGEAGRKELLALVEAASTPDEVAARAVEALGEALPFATLRALLDRALKQGQHELARAARQVLAAIQARLHGAEGGGQLSLAGSEAGALSLTEEREAGRVSLAETESQAAPKMESPRIEALRGAGH